MDRLFERTARQIVDAKDPEKFIQRLKDLIGIEKEVYDRRMGPNWLDRVLVRAEELRQEQS